MGKLTWKTAKLHLDFSFILFSSFTMTITLKFPFPPFPSAEVWGEVEVWGLLLPDWFFRGDCRCIQRHSWGSSPCPGWQKLKPGALRALSTALLWLPWPRAKSEISTAQAPQWHPGMCPEGMHSEFLLCVLVAVNSLAGASLSPQLWSRERRAVCILLILVWFPLLYLSVSPPEIPV